MGSIDKTCPLMSHRAVSQGQPDTPLLSLLLSLASCTLHAPAGSPGIKPHLHAIIYAEKGSFTFAAM